MLYFNDPEEFRQYLSELIDEIESGEFDNYDPIGLNVHQIPVGNTGCQFYQPMPQQMPQPHYPQYRPPAAYNVGTGFVMWQVTKPTKETITNVSRAYAAGNEYCGWVSDLGVYVFDPDVEGETLEQSKLPNTMKRNMYKMTVMRETLNGDKVIGAILSENGFGPGQNNDREIGTITVSRDVKDGDKNDPLLHRLQNGFEISSSNRNIKEVHIPKERVKEFVMFEKHVIYVADIKLINAYEIYNHENNYGRIMGTLIGIDYDTMFDDYRTLLNSIKGGVPLSFIKSWIPGETLWSVFAIMGGGNPIRRYGPMHVAISDI